MTTAAKLAPRAGTRVALLGFWGASLSVGLAAFVVLAVLAHTGAPGELAAASAVIGVSFVLAVIPGAIQLRGAAQAAAGADRAEWPADFVAASTAALLAISPLLAAAVGAPPAAIALLAPQYAAACLASAQRGLAIGRADHARAAESMAIEAAVRLIAGVAFGVAFGAAGLAAALLLGSAGAAVSGSRWAGAPRRGAARLVVAPALSVGLLMLLVNLDALGAPRLLGAAGADAYALAELPARGVFFALFAVSWIAVPLAGHATSPRELLAPIGVVLGLGAAAGLTLLSVRPLLTIALGDPAPPAGLLGSLIAAMTIAAALATALAMAVARGARAPWLPTLAATLGLAAALVVTQPGPSALAILVLASTGAALLLTLGGLVHSAGRSAVAAHPHPAPR